MDHHKHAGDLPLKNVASGFTHHTIAEAWRNQITSHAELVASLKFFGPGMRDTLDKALDIARQIKRRELTQAYREIDGALPQADVASPMPQQQSQPHVPHVGESQGFTIVAATQKPPEILKSAKEADHERVNADKAKLRESGFRPEDVDAFLDKWVNLDDYAALSLLQDIAFVVTSSSSRVNRIPYHLARKLQRRYGGEVFFDFGQKVQTAEAKKKVGFLKKMRDPSRFDVSADRAAELKGKQVVIVEDLFTSGDTSTGLVAALNQHGIDLHSVAAITAARGGRLASPKAYESIADLLAEKLNLDRGKCWIHFLKHSPTLMTTSSPNSTATSNPKGTLRRIPGNIFVLERSFSEEEIQNFQTLQEAYNKWAADPEAKPEDSPEHNLDPEIRDAWSDWASMKMTRELLEWEEKKRQEKANQPIRKRLNARAPSPVSKQANSIGSSSRHYPIETASESHPTSPWSVVSVYGIASGYAMTEPTGSTCSRRS